MSGWIGEAREHSIREVAAQFGLKSARGQSMTPCPACKAERRSKSDSRGPVGLRTDGKGWRCWSCSVAGDGPDIVAWATEGKPMRDLEKSRMRNVREAMAGKGLCSSSDASKKIVPIVRKAASVAPQRGPSPLDWRSDLVSDCEKLLWTDAGKITLAYMQGRGFNEQTLRKWHIGSLHIQRKNGIEYYVTIPVLDKDGMPVNMRFRSVPHVCAWCGGEKCKRCKQTGMARKVYLRSPGRPSTLFGIKNLAADTDQDVIICEGELDVVALYQLGFTHNVVSGTAGAGAWSDEWLDCLEPYKHFVLSYDADAAGDAGAKGVADKLGRDRCSRAVLPFKDAAECLEQCVGGEKIKKALDDAQPLLEAGIVRIDNYTQEIETLIANPSQLRGLPTGSQALDDALGGLRPGLWIVTGDTAAGKTSFATWLALEQGRRGVGVLLTSFEQRPVGTVQKLLRAEIGGDFTLVTQEQRAIAMETLGKLPIYMVDHYGHLDPDELSDLMGYAVRRRDVRMAVIDHLGFLIDGAEDERRAIEKVVREYAVFAVHAGITLVLICHPNNLSVAQQRRVKLGDLKGASAIRQDAHVGLVLERMLPGRAIKHPACAVHVDKCRSEFGLQGARAVLYYDPEACVYADKWEDTPTGRSGHSRRSPDIVEDIY